MSRLSRVGLLTADFLLLTVISPGLLGRRARPGVPASHEQRGRSGVSGRTATTLLARRRPPSEPGEPSRSALPVSAPPASCWAPRLISSRYAWVPNNYGNGTSVRGRFFRRSKRYAGGVVAVSDTAPAQNAAPVTRPCPRPCPGRRPGSGAVTASATVTAPAYPQPRPSGTPMASRRPSAARAAWSRGRLPDGLRPRCSCERRPTSEPEEPFRYALPVECPVAQLCGMYCGAGRSYLHNRVPGTPGGAPFPRALPRSRSLKRPLPRPRSQSQPRSGDARPCLKL